VLLFLPQYLKGDLSGTRSNTGDFYFPCKVTFKKMEGKSIGSRIYWLPRWCHPYRACYPQIWAGGGDSGGAWKNAREGLFWKIRKCQNRVAK